MMKQLGIVPADSKVSDDYTGESASDSSSMVNASVGVMGLRSHKRNGILAGSAEMQEWSEIETALNTVQMVCMIQGIMSLVFTVLFKKLR